MKAVYWLFGSAVGLSAAAALAATPAAPATPRPLSAIVQAIEGEAGQIVEAELDDGLWEIKQCSRTACQKLYVDPATGKEIRRRATDLEQLPPANAKPLAALLTQVESTQKGRIVEAEFDHDVWEVKLREAGRSHKLWLDPVTGKQLR